MGYSNGHTESKLDTVTVSSCLPWLKKSLCEILGICEFCFLFPEVGNKGKSYVSDSQDILDNSMFPTLQ